MTVHTVVFTADTVRSGFLDPTASPVATVAPDDLVDFPDTWTHWGNEAVSGMTFAEREPLRHRDPNGPYSMMGPVEVAGAGPGDAIELGVVALPTRDWGWRSPAHRRRTLTAVAAGAPAWSEPSVDGEGSLRHAETVRIRMLQPVEAGDGLALEVRGLAVAGPDWALQQVLVEPPHRLGLGRWVPFGAFGADETDALSLSLSEADLSALPEGESLRFEDGVQSDYPLFALPAGQKPLRSTVSPRAPEGTFVLNGDTKVLVGDDDPAPLDGLDIDDVGRVVSVLVLQQGFLRHHSVPVDVATAHFDEARNQIRAG